MHRTYSHVGPIDPRLIFKKRGWDVGPTNLMIDFQKWRMDYFVVIFKWTCYLVFSHPPLKISPWICSLMADFKKGRIGE
jgi:hypothetical protein